MSGTGHSILLVEDDAGHALLITWAFERARDRISIVHAPSLAAATAQLELTMPSLILCDYLLPDGSGIDFIRQIRMAGPQDIPVVLLTSHGNEEIAVEAMKAGATDYIVKTESSLASLPDICRGILRELAERRLLLRKSDERYRMLAENMGEGILIIEPQEYRISYCNKALGSILGVSESELTGRSILDFIDTDSRQTFLDERPKRLQGLSSRYPLTFVRPNGEKVYTLISGHPIFGDNGEVTGSFGVISDITEYRRLEEQLRQTQRIESLGRLAGGVAHDFNNKLTVILGNTELAQMELPDTGRLQERLQDISLAARHARDITAQLLAFSRQQAASPRPIDTADAVREVMKSLARLIPGNIIIEPRLPEQLWSIRIDPVQLDQIIINLAVNARDAMPDGGRFIIEAENIIIDQHFCCSVGQTQPGPYVRLTFTDTGIGMDSAMLQHIFEPFYTTKEVGKGTGLGLATIHGIITQNNGFITVVSKPDQGSVFTVYLPRHELPMAQLPPQDRQTCGGNGAVLVVEDDDAVRLFIAQCLTRIGYTVHQAANPAQALELVLDLSCRIDIVLSDVIMPEMSGPALMERISAIRPGLPVLYMSGHPQDSIARQGIGEGILNFIHKPFEITQLNLRLQQMLHNEED